LVVVADGGVGAEMSAQRFGGPWSLIKVEAVSAYLQRFNSALKRQSFERIYIDAFAGSGSFTFGSLGAGSLFDEDKALGVHAGSAQRALETTPPFHRLFFVESDPKNIKSLRSLAEADARRRATVVEGDANEEVRRICREIDWRRKRGVIFLDPFGNTVDWPTLKAVAETKALDLWYLFPLSGVLRNAPHNRAALTADKHASVARIVGTDGWEDHFYAQPTASAQTLLFDSVPIPGPDQRVLSVDGVETYIKRQLETVFPAVEEPRRLLGPSNSPMYSLFFAMANPSPYAQAVARRIARHILRKR
jgi:three-Cys-motif partner protein